jgi:hypothetical protein
MSAVRSAPENAQYSSQYVQKCAMVKSVNRADSDALAKDPRILICAYLRFRIYRGAMPEAESSCASEDL